ncbi:hypothetical protein EDD86DRAFT_211566, partial [Gorgonomyces haynaldii]
MTEKDKKEDNSVSPGWLLVGVLGAAAVAYGAHKMASPQTIVSPHAAQPLLTIRTRQTFNPQAYKETEFAEKIIYLVKNGQFPPMIGIYATILHQNDELVDSQGIPHAEFDLVFQSGGELYLIEVKWLDHESTGATARTRRTDHRSKVRSQAQRNAHRLKEHYPKFMIRWYAVVNDQFGGPECIKSGKV